jgi:hypothetical protein
MRVEIASSHVTGLYKIRAHCVYNRTQVATPTYWYWGSCAAGSRAKEVPRFVSRRLRYEYTTYLLPLSIHHLPTPVINTPPTYSRYQYTTYLLPLSIHQLPTPVINTPAPYCRYQHTTSEISYYNVQWVIGFRARDLTIFYPVLTLCTTPYTNVLLAATYGLLTDLTHHHYNSR